MQGQYYLARLLESRGDADRGARWYRKAARQGHLMAMHRLDRLACGAELCRWSLSAWNAVVSN